MIFSKAVTVLYSKKDKYGRTVGKIIIDGIDESREQVKAGMGRHYKKYQNEQTVEERYLYAHAEDAARVEKIGSWIDKEPMPPWYW